jgi:hypothetical protein
MSRFPCPTTHLYIDVMPRVVLAYLIDRTNTKSPLVEVQVRDEIEIGRRRHLFRSIDIDGVPVYAEVPFEGSSQSKASA